MGNEDRLYDYVYRDLITKIYTGKFSYGEEIPTLMEICELYDVSRNTARSAIKLLEENGYVKTTPRKPPVVCFDLNNPEYRPKYLKEFAERRETVAEIFEAFALLMPDISAHILSATTAEDRERIVEMLISCVGDVTKVTEQELADNLFQTYEAMIRISRNNLLAQLFAAWFHFIIIPSPETKQRSLTFRAMLPMVRRILKKLGRLATEQRYDDMKKQIALFSRAVGKKTIVFFEDECKDIVIDQREEFHWFAGASQEIGYLSVAAAIIGEIRTGIYQQGDVLPSYASLATSMGVSEKTSRKAIEVLNKLKIVATINGVGTKVTSFKVEDVIESLKDEAIKQNMKTFFEAMHLITLTCGEVAKNTLTSMDDEQLDKLKQLMSARRNISISRFVDTIYCENKSTVLQNMYIRIRPALTMGYLFEFLWSDQTDKQENTAEDFLALIEKKNYDEVAKRIKSATAEAYNIAKDFAQDQGLELNLLPEEFDY